MSNNNEQQQQQADRADRLAAAQVRRRRLIEERNEIDLLIQGLRSQIERAERLRGNLTEDISLVQSEIYDLENNLNNQAQASSSEPELPRTQPRLSDGRFQKIHDSDEDKREARRLKMQRYRAKLQAQKDSGINPETARAPVEGEPTVSFSAADFQDCLPLEVAPNSICLACTNKFKKKKGNKDGNVDENGQRWWVCRYCYETIEENCMSADEKAQAVAFTCATCIANDRGICFQALKKAHR